MTSMGFNDTIKWYDENAEQYAEANAQYFDLNHVRTFAELLHPGASVLDAGCGTGRDANLLSQQGLDVTGVDLSRGLLRVARSNFPAIKFVDGNMLSLPFDNESFDGAWSNTSLLHFETAEDVKKALSEMNRVLRPQGILHVLVKAQTGDSKTAVVTDKLSGHDRFFQYFTTDEMTELLVAGDFVKIEITEYPETDTVPNGRPEVRLIRALARKN